MKLCVTYSDEKTMITIGDVCPLFFNTLNYEYANEGSFRQCFDLSDGILLQVFCDGGETPSAYLNDKIKSSSSSISFKTYSVNEDVSGKKVCVIPARPSGRWLRTMAALPSSA